MHVLKNNYVRVIAALFTVSIVGYYIIYSWSPNQNELIDSPDNIAGLSIDQVNQIIAKENKNAKTKHTYYFAFELRNGPLEDARQYLPFLDYLNRATGYDFRLRFLAKNQSVIDAIGLGDVDFAAIGAVALIRAQEKYNVINLVRGKNKLNRTQYRSYIVANKNSSFKTLADLKGKRFAFGSRTSTQGHLIPRIMLRKAGLTIDDFSSYIYTGSHKNCASAVIQGIADACGMQDTLAMQLIKYNDLKKIDFSNNYPSSGIAAYAKLPPQVIRKVMDALLDFRPLGRDKQPLYNWEKTEMPNGFGISVSSDYKQLHRWLDVLGLINSKKHSSRQVKP